MNMPLKHAYSLFRRGGPGLACDEDGLALGTLELARIRQGLGGVRRCEVRSSGEIDQILRAAFGPQPVGVVARIHRGLRRAAACIETGELGRASVEAVKLGLPGLSPDALAKLSAVADDLEKAGDAWEEQPRVPAGQTGGGQWTEGAGHGQSANPGPPAKPLTPPPPSARPAPHKAPKLSPHAPPKSPRRAPINEGQGSGRSLLIHVSSPSIAVGWPGARAPVARPTPVPRITLPRIAVPLPGPAQVLNVAAQLLDASTIQAARGQISNAISHFGLDPSRRSDVMAAAAYVWSRYAFQWRLDLPARGPGLGAASEAVMRYVMIHPDAFPAVMQGDRKAYSAILGALDRGLADYVWESRARPVGVNPALQTKSWVARAAIADMLKTGRMAAHHLVPAQAWGAYEAVAQRAQEAEWHQDAPSNLIGLPRDPAAQEEALAVSGIFLPIHNSGHDQYNTWTMSRLAEEVGGDASKLTALRARAILDDVAEENRQRILSGQIGRIMRVER